MTGRKAYLLAATMMIAGCGGGDDDGSGDNNGGNNNDSPTVAQGVFKDSNVGGVQYASGAQSGTTEDGQFSYEVGTPVTFSIGGVTIGTADGAETVTPMDMVSGADSGTVEVQNRVRFLMMLDSDEDATNGISVSSAVQAAAENWSEVDFSTDDLENELVDIRSDVASVDGRVAAVPDAITAKSHLESTLRCVYSGGYQGTFSGDDSGTFGFIVDAANGSVSGVAYSDSMEMLITLSGATPLSYEQQPAFVSGITDDGGTFSGSFDNPDSVSGSWENGAESESGTFNGERIGGAMDARYRFTGRFAGDDSGLFTFDIDASGDVTGVAYSVVFDELLDLSGTLVGTDLEVTAQNDTVVTATLDIANGTITGGAWQAADGSGDTGTFTGSGCRLN